MDPFAAPVDEWQMLDPAQLRLKRLMVLLVWPAQVAVAALLVGWLWHVWAGVAVAVLGAAWVGYRWWRQAPVYRRWGFAERDTDLYLREGIWFRRLTVVPYGRMQLVEVNSGPLQRRFGLATVHLKTASAHTNAEIPGLSAEQATRLRDRLTTLGEQQAVGL